MFYWHFDKNNHSPVWKYVCFRVMSLWNYRCGFGITDNTCESFVLLVFMVANELLLDIALLDLDDLNGDIANVELVVG